MNECRLLPLVAALIWGGVALCEDAPKKGGLDGVWLAKKVVRGGTEAGKGETTSLVIEGTSLTWHSARRAGDKGTTSSIAFTIKTDAKKGPASIDLRATEGGLKGKVFPGIYSLDGDTLKVVRTQPGDKRPTGFESKKGSEHVLLILERRKAE